MSINRSHKNGLSVPAPNTDSGFGQLKWAFERLIACAEELRALARQANASTEESRALLLEIKTYLDASPIISSHATNLITITEAARRLACSERQITRLGESGDLEIFRLGRHIRVTTRSVDRLIETNIGNKEE
jgi:excisionase family DNA binding protein